MVVEDSSSLSTPENRTRPKSQELGSPSKRLGTPSPHHDHNLDDIAPRGGSREWSDHPLSVKDEQEKPPVPERDSDAGSDFDRQTEETDDEAPIPQDERARGEPQACLFVAR